MIKIALVDDHPVTRRGIAMLIESTDEIQIVMEASNGAELLKKYLVPVYRKLSF